MRTSHLGAFVFAIGVLAMLAIARPAVAGPGLVAGAVEDDLRASTLVDAETRMALMRVSGFRAVRVTSYWQPGDKQPTEGELQVLQNVAAAADRNGIRLYVTVMHPGSRTTPLTSDARSDFASYAATIVREAPAVQNLIIANEPNLNRFWLPQFALDGSSEAPAAYLALLTQAYDAVKAVSPEVTVYGGAVSPRGTDRPNGIRPTHSPTTFIQALGAAYRASGRTLPDHGRVRDPRVRRRLEHPADEGQPPDDGDRRRGLRQARRAPRAGVRRHGTEGLDAPDPLRGVRRRDADPGREAEPLHRHRAHDHEARARGDAG